MGFDYINNMFDKFKNEDDENDCQVIIGQNMCFFKQFLSLKDLWWLNMTSKHTLSAHFLTDKVTC
jgi:hypothetical protein